MASTNIYVQVHPVVGGQRGILVLRNPYQLQCLQGMGQQEGCSVLRAR